MTNTKDLEVQEQIEMAIDKESVELDPSQGFERYYNVLKGNGDR